MKRLAITFYLCISSALFLFAQSERVSEILKDAPVRVGEIVIVDGLVTQLEDAKNINFNDYWLKDKYGGLILIHTDGKTPPTTNKKYTVKGYLTFNKENNMYFISETERTQLSDDAFVFVTDESNTSNEETYAPLPWWEQHFKNIAIIGSIVIILLIIIAFSVSRKGNKSGKSKTSYTSEFVDSSTKSKIDKPVSDVVQKNTEELKTIIIPKAAPKTMKFVPGKLEIIKGADIGKTFKIAGIPQSDGSSIVTIGREASTEANMFSHIQLKEHTISRKQAEIIERNGSVKIKNLSTTNYTKIDGKELAPNEIQELKPNSIITLGEVEIKYIL